MKLTILLLPLFFLGIALAEPSSFPVFPSVIGQPNFTSNEELNPPTASSLNGPEGIAIDPTTGKLFVADAGNDRILRFSSTAAYETGAAAEVVLGQTAFDETSDGLSATKMSSLTGIFVDQEGRLWVSDRGNDRVLRFDNASTIGTGAPANGVIGQPDLDSDVDPGTPPHSKFEDPTGIFVTPDGTLWVVDDTLARILRFDNAATLNGEVMADQVIGQPDLETFGEDTTQEALKSPWGVWVDEGGNLFVGDHGNDRVLRFDNVVNQGNGPPASAVFGQPDFERNLKG
ncbi:MAG: NHL repeat-containing protein, partial [Verrucomicrobiota bacterium]